MYNNYISITIYRFGRPTPPASIYIQNCVEKSVGIGIAGRLEEKFSRSSE